MEENRKVKQIKKYDEDGKLECVVIPNYKKCNFFMSANEIKFYKFIFKVIYQLRESHNYDLTVFPQVAINRIIEQNNKREKELEKDLFGKSIDFTIYNKKTNAIVCCIELDGPEHRTDPARIERDKIINKAFESSDLKLIRQPYSDNYKMSDYIDILEECVAIKEA